MDCMLKNVGSYTHLIEDICHYKSDFSIEGPSVNRVELSLSFNETTYQKIGK